MEAQGTSAVAGADDRASRPPRVIYVSYDGALEPLGRSQVLAYLERLAASFDIALISFEKSMEGAAELRAELSRLGIEWLPQRYHRRPPVLSTVLDVMTAWRVLIRSARRRRPAVIHVRSDVPALMALLARPLTGGRILFDIRGFWADERIEGGIWRPDGVLYRVAKRCERWFFAQADAVVTQTHASVPRVRELMGDRDAPIEVIPNCVDLKRFGARPARSGSPHAVWSGSIGTWYRFDLAPRVAAALSMPLTVLTRQTELARSVLAGHPAAVRSVPPGAMPEELFAGDIGLCLITGSASKVASAPTRFAEYLAVGMPVVATSGTGDLDAIIEQHGVGVVIRSEDDGSLDEAATVVRSLASDPDAWARCRRVAAELFDADVGARRYGELYRRLAGS